ncbi:FecR family protein [Chitinimonas sp. PSY-7]|uniref:FecR domain-containing protein n=1 Tax=Chitinimonas sp. PSY-7 TaxID=3459088 RepID=UPI00403FEBD0
MCSKLAQSILASLLTVTALAAANVTTVRGQISVTGKDGSSKPLVDGARVEAGSKIVTGSNGFAILRFDDGQVIALEKNTDFTIDQFRFNRAQPEDGNAFFSMLRGTLRAVTGLIGQQNKAAFRLNTPTATIGIRGSDWMAALQGNSLYTGVNAGGITVKNGANSLLVDAGQYSATAGANASQLVSLSQLPAGVFGSLPNLSLGAVSTSAAGSASVGAETGAAGGVLGGVGSTAIAVGVGIAAVVAVTSDSDDSSSTHHSSTTHQGSGQ